MQTELMQMACSYSFWKIAKAVWTYYEQVMFYLVANLNIKFLYNNFHSFHKTTKTIKFFSIETFHIAT